MINPHCRIGKVVIKPYAVIEVPSDYVRHIGAADLRTGQSIDAQARYEQWNTDKRRAALWGFK